MKALVQGRMSCISLELKMKDYYAILLLLLEHYLSEV
jgi:hypothetical protein